MDADVSEKNKLTKRVSYLSLYITGFFSLSISPMIGILVPLLALEWGASPFMVGLSVSAGAILPLFFSISTGALIDQLGSKRVLLSSSFFLILISILYPLFPYIIILIIIQLVYGQVQAMNWISSQTYLAKLKETPDYTTYTSYFSFAVNLGNFVGPMTVGLVWDFFGAFASFMVICFWAICLWFSAYLLPAEDLTSLEKQGLPDQKVFIPRWHDYQRAFVLLANPTVLFVMYGTFLRLSAVAVLGSFFVVYMKELAFTASTIAFLSSLFFLVAVFSPLYLRIFARYGEKRLLLITFILSIVPMGLIPLFNEVWEFAILLSIAGCAVGLSYPLLMTIMSRSVDTHELGLAIGLRSTVNRLAASTVPIGFGLLAQGIGLEVSFYIIGGLLIAPIFYFLRVTKG